ncbi:MAG: hypothetical protein VKL20_07620 [Synechocystis sp.]|nr:hypothetical protein [Synechocystis sp.]
MANPNKATNPDQDPSSTPEAPWWNRPVLGKGGLMEELIQAGGKEELPEAVLLDRRKQLTDMLVFAKTAEAINSKQFLADEFVSYIKIKYMLAKEMGEYAGLNKSTSYLQLAINAKDLLIYIDQTELRYRGFKQQEFYEKVAALLKKGDNPAVFRQQLEADAVEAIAQTKTEEGQEALTNYVNNLKQISDNPLGLQLLNRFRAFQLSDYSILSTISDMIRRIEVKHVYDINRLTMLASDNYNLFEKLSKIIQVPAPKINPRSFAIMLQFIALTHQYEITALKFEELVRVLRKWKFYYQNIITISQEYPSRQYKYPDEFSEAIPGEELYLQYVKLLTDKKQGVCYYDLG